MNRAKTLFLTVLAVVVVIVVAQNTETVETQLLFVSIAMPRAVLLLVTLVTGFVLGILVGTRSTRRDAKKE